MRGGPGGHNFGAELPAALAARRSEATHGR